MVPDVIVLSNAKMSRQAIASRAFDKTVLAKLAMATGISGFYYLMQGPYVSFDRFAYGYRAVFAKLKVAKLPVGINGFPPIISEELQKLIDAAKADINLPEEVMERIEYRTAAIVMPDQYGSARLHRAYAALPDYVNVCNVTELRANSLNSYMNYLYKWKVEDPELWLSPVGKLLVDSFVLSDRAKKFLIARQAYMADNDLVAMFSPLFFLFTYLFYFASDIVFKKTRHASSGIQAFFMGSTFCLCFMNYFLLRYMKIQKMHYDADARAITKGAYSKAQMDAAASAGEKLPIDHDYYEGAIEFYSKELQRNRAMRLLIKKVSKAIFYDESGQFTEDGDFRRNTFSMDPFPSRAIRNLVNWKLNRKAPDPPTHLW